MTQAEAEAIAATLYNALKVERACTCERTFPYHGVGKRMCRRCAVLVEYETLTTGASETRATFEANRP